MPALHKTRQIRLREDVANLAEQVAALQEKPVSTPVFLSELLEPILYREREQALERLQKERRKK